MLKPQREDAILKEIRLRGTVAVATFAERLGVSAITLRRDLVALEERGLLTRVHGGATTLALATPSATPGAATAALRPGRLPTIGMIAPTTDNYYAGIIHAAKATAHARGVRLVLGITNYIESDERRQIAGMIASGADGLIVTPARVDFTDSPTMQLLIDSPIPVVLVERSLDQYSGDIGLESVRSDHEFGAEMSVHHLVKNGHTRISLLSSGNPTSPRLLTGYRKAVADLNLEEFYPASTLTDAAWSTEQQAGDIRKLIAELRGRGVTGLIIQPDRHAMALVQVALNDGLRIPEDLAVVAYDDQFSELAEVPLTAVTPPAADLGRNAIDMCLRRMSGPAGAAPGIQQVRIMPALTIRASSVAS